MSRLSARIHWRWVIVCALATAAAMVLFVRVMAPTRPSPEKIYVAFFMGQGGYFLSWGIPYLAWRARALGMETDVFGYSELREAWTSIGRKRADGYKIALVGYSLGNSTATYLQRHLKVDLLLAVAQSSLGRNYPIDKRNTRRSVLWYGPDFLSNGGLKNGFDKMNYVDAFHLWMGVDPRVLASVLRELMDLADKHEDASHPAPKPSVLQTTRADQVDGNAAAHAAPAPVANDRLPIIRGANCSQCRGSQTSVLADEN